MFQEQNNELHAIIKKLRLEKGLTQKEVAEYLEVDISVYVDYELARSTPNAKELKILSEIYDVNDKLLGAKLPIVTKIVYPKELLVKLETAIKECPDRTGNYRKDKLAYEKLNSALEPVLEFRNNAFDFPNIDLERSDMVTQDQTVKSVEIDNRVEKLIEECLEKQKELIMCRESQNLNQ